MRSTPDETLMTSLASAADECYRCGYALHGIANDQACPECGLLAERSRRVTDELHNTRPKWLARLSLGTKLILAASIIGPIWPAIVEIVQEQVWRLSLRGQQPFWASVLGYEIIPFAGFDLCTLMLLAGIWLLTGSEKYQPADRADRARRILLRVISFAPLFAAVTLHVVLWRFSRFFFRTPRNNESNALWAIFWALITIAALTIPPLLFRQLRSLAVRARSSHLAEHCTIVGFGAAGSITFLLAVLLTLAFPASFGLPKNWTTTSQASLLIMCAGCVAAVLFLLWSIYLFLRFTISFHFAARAMRRKWARDDRALTSAPPDVA